MGRNVTDCSDGFFLDTLHFLVDRDTKFSPFCEVVVVALLAVGSSFCHASENGSDLDWLEQYNVVWTTQSKNAGE